MSQTYPDPAAARRKKRRRALLALLLGASLLTVGTGAMSLATFTDTTNAGGSWTAGTILLGVDPTITFNVEGIMPGDTGSQDITVQNEGTGELRYAMSSSATNADDKGLAAQLDLTVDAGTCAAPGDNLYTGPLGGAAFGDLALGDDPGNPVVAAGGTDDLCFSWSFPLSSGNGFQGATTDATFTFDAEQTANNP